MPSKTLRAAILQLTGMVRGSYRSPYRRADIEIDDLLWRTQQVIEHERAVIDDQLRRNRVDVITGAASFVDPHTLAVDDGEARHLVHAERIVIAVGTRPARPAGVDFDGATVLDSDGILELRRIPRTLTVVGAGVIGLEYASMAAALGVRVTVVDKRLRMLDFVDEEIVEALQYHLRGLGRRAAPRRGGRGRRAPSRRRRR